MGGALPGWDDLVTGRGCPFCAPREADDGFNIHIADLSVSSLYLDRNQVHTGYSVLIFKKRHVTGIEQLTDTEYDAFARDLKHAARAIAAAVPHDHMNYATLGNVIPHLHYHLIPRRQDEPRWAAPVWTSHLSEMLKKELPAEGYQTLIRQIKDALGNQK